MLSCVELLFRLSYANQGFDGHALFQSNQKKPKENHATHKVITNKHHPQEKWSQMPLHGKAWVLRSIFLEEDNFTSSLTSYLSFHRCHCQQLHSRCLQNSLLFFLKSELEIRDQGVNGHSFFRATLLFSCIRSPSHESSPDDLLVCSQFSFFFFNFTLYPWTQF